MKRGQFMPMLLRFIPEIRRIDIAVLVAGHHHDFEPGHHRTGGICAVGRLRNEADIPMPLTAFLVIFAYHQKAGILSLRAGVRLK